MSMFYDKSYHQQVLYQHQQATAASAMHQNHQHNQQQQRYDALREWSLAQSQRNPQFYPQNPWPVASSRPVQIPSAAVAAAAAVNQRSQYSGVEQLLMAAMIEGNYPHHSSVVNYSSSLPQQQQHIHSPQRHSSFNQMQQSCPPARVGTDSPLPASLQPTLPIGSAPLADDPGDPDYLPVGRGLGYRSSLQYARPNERPTIDEIDIPTPRNGSELRLYRLLESANLLDYFGTFLHFGGDDVQQLSDADEEEFMEIMDLVGMNKKPLHIRRLQRALVNWRLSQNQNKDKCDEENFKRPRLGASSNNCPSHNQHRINNSNGLSGRNTSSSSSIANRCPSPCDSRRSQHTDATIDTSHPPTPRSTSSQSFLMIPDDPRAESRSLMGEDNLINHEQGYQRPHVLVNAPKRIRLFNPTQINRNQCKTT